jgi:hypothetical protein
VLLENPTEDYPKLVEKFAKLDEKIRSANDYF